MGKRKVLLPAAMLLSALSALAGMLPYILIWLIVRELLEYGEITSSGNVVTYAWWAAGMAGEYRPLFCRLDVFASCSFSG